MGLCILGMCTEMHIEFTKCPLCLYSFKHTVSLQAAGSIMILSIIFKLGYMWMNIFMDWEF